MLFEQLNLDRLLAKMWEEMGLVRVYTKPQGQQPDFSEPVVLSLVCGIICLHHDKLPLWTACFRYAQVH